MTQNCEQGLQSRGPRRTRVFGSVATSTDYRLFAHDRAPQLPKTDISAFGDSAFCRMTSLSQVEAMRQEAMPRTMLQATMDTEEERPQPKHCIHWVRLLTAQLTSIASPARFPQ